MIKDKIVINFKKNADFFIGIVETEQSHIDGNFRGYILLSVTRIDLPRPQKKFERYFRPTDEFKEYQKKIEKKIEVRCYKGELQRIAKMQLNCEMNVYILRDKDSNEDTIKELSALSQLAQENEQLRTTIEHLKTERTHVLENISGIVNQDLSTLERGRFDAHINKIRQLMLATEKDSPLRKKDEKDETR